MHSSPSGSHGCQCPNHGTDCCDCQMIVLLVHATFEEPVTLILHGNDGQTRLSVVEGMGTNTRLADQVRETLAFKAAVSRNLV